MTLQGTFFNDEKNDVSFLAGTRQIILMEHQSTLNENMPLRMFWYMAKLYLSMSVKWRRFSTW